MAEWQIAEARKLHAKTVEKANLLMSKEKNEVAKAREAAGETVVWEVDGDPFTDSFGMETEPAFPPNATAAIPANATAVMWPAFAAAAGGGAAADPAAATVYGPATSTPCNRATPYGSGASTHN